MTQNKFCPSCGTSMDSNAKFCPKCGQQIFQTISVREKYTDQQMLNQQQYTQPDHNESILSINLDKEKVKQQFFNFEGRLARQQFIIRGLIISGIVIGVFIFIEIIAEAFSNPYDFSDLLFSGILELLLLMIAAVANFSLQCRRWHDLNMSGWMGLLTLVPLINLITLIYLMCARGTQGENKYGVDILQQ